MRLDYSNLDITSNRLWSWQLGIAFGVLIAVWSLGAGESIFAKFIFPYALAVGLVAWKHGLFVGFLIAAMATLVAFASSAIPSRSTSADHQAVEGLITYAKLSVVCLSVCFVRRQRKKSGK